MARELIIYTDESERRGDFYSNFFGGALVRSEHLMDVVTQLQTIKDKENLHKEIKWTRVTSNYLNKYVAVMDSFFDLVQQNKIKVRIMFTANRYVPQNLTRQQREDEYFLLYYQFLKHAFGLRFLDTEHAPVRCRIYLDDLPDTREKNAQFKGFIEGLMHTTHLRGKILLSGDQIAEVKSHDHVILQCLDIVLGAMHFRLNNKHLQKPHGARVRGKRTRAKEALYKHINARIRHIYPGFNIGNSTGRPRGPRDSWEQPYRHWLFIPKDHQYDERYEK